MRFNAAYSLPSLRRLLSVELPQRVIDDDVWRIESAWLGPWQWPSRPDGVVLKFGVRAGLTALADALAMPAARIVAVETDSLLRRCLADAALRGRAKNLEVVASVEEAFARLAGIATLDFVKVDLGYFTMALLDDVFARFTVRHIAGEFEGAGALALQRLSRAKTESFFWRNVEGAAFSGRGSRAPEVSIVVPAYKVAQYLPRCIESLLAQTLRAKEIIVVDDGSPDESGRIADGYAAAHPGIVRVIHKPNGGCASARNAGIDAARGDYIGFCDGDDWCDERMFEALYGAAALHNADIAQCGFRHVFDQGGIRDELVDTGEVRLADPLPHLNRQPAVWRRIYRRDFLAARAIRFAEQVRLFDDLPFWMETTVQASRLVLVPGAHYNYRLGRDGQDVSISDRRLWVHFDLFDHLHARLGTGISYRVEKQLAQVEVASHLWALSKLELALKKEYIHRAARELFARRRTVSSLALVAGEFAVSFWRGLFALRCWALRHSSP